MFGPLVPVTVLQPTATTWNKDKPSLLNPTRFPDSQNGGEDDDDGLSTKLWGALFFGNR